MKLKDGFYASSHGIGGLMLDMPTKNPKTRKKPKFKVGDMVRCEAEGFIYPFSGYVKHIYDNSAMVTIDSTHPKDDHLVVERGGRTIVPFTEMRAVEC